MIKLSVTIITLNEERNIARCLQSVKNIADEVLVVDSLSTDNTAGIAKSLGAKVIEQKFTDYATQRNIATEQATYDWVLMMDADEVISPELEKSILNMKNAPSCDIYFINRFTNYCGKWIKHCGWYPDKLIRLYNRTKGKWTGHLVHESWQPNDQSDKTGLLKGDMLHYTFSTIKEHVEQIHKFTELSAKAAADAGKNYGLMRLWLGPKWFFFSRFYLKLGFMDGYYGYLVCKLSAYAQLIKYSKTRQYNEMKRKGLPY